MVVCVYVCERVSECVCVKHKEAISTLSGKSLKLVD